MFTKKLSARLLTVAGATALILGVSPSTQADDAFDDLDVSAEVEAVCTITATAVDFANYDPVVVNAATPDAASGNLAVTCTTGASATVKLDEGDNEDTGSTLAVPLRRLHDTVSDEYLNYQLYSDAGTTVWTGDTGVAYLGTGGNSNLTVFGRIPAGQNVPEGTYTDQVLATITF